ncbi:tagaturonate epimerase family protein [Oceanobacillus sp. FSL H7-0719]|uniref:tagaturonate epimerase family protein n=1 Tax=Oceanobacillus sp. FSL H7-0719 TaxID=2954507 RepID=UPI0032469E4A
MEQLKPIFELLKAGKVSQSNRDVKVYEKSLETYENVNLIMVRLGAEKYILAAGDGKLFDELSGEVVDSNCKAAPLTHENRLVLNAYFEYTVPRAFGTKVSTMGLGDRLGIASPGHIETIRKHHIKPILAQQSIRELTLINRTMPEMIDAACFAVFQEGYKDGFGADGDHIKEEKDIAYALELGISMLTLDCSDQIKKGIDHAPIEKIERAYNSLPKEKQTYYEQQYLDKTFEIGELVIIFDKETLMKNVLVYDEAISYIDHVYKTYISKLDREFDFEISIDETETITLPAEHFFVANELRERGVKAASLAPRFCGEFQKGIDYIGDMEQFEVELAEHALIAKHFGYKLSIHSGSDKFSVFPIIAKYTEGVLHIKTAGTNWLEAMRVIAETNPKLYRRMHAYATENIEEALQYYHITPDFSAIKPLDSVPDEALSEYMNDDNARQLIHVTYGVLLTAEDETGNYLFKDEFFQTLHHQEDAYRKALVKHIGRHITTLGF